MNYDEHNDKTVLQIPCTLSDYKSMVHGVRIWFDTQETIPPDILIRILELHNQLGWLFFGVKQIQPQDVVDVPEIKVEKNQKSSSQILRNRMYVYHKARFGTSSNFDVWYIKEMDRIGQRYLEEIL